MDQEKNDFMRSLACRPPAPGLSGGVALRPPVVLAAALEKDSSS
jgi:hypothetical protein